MREDGDKKDNIDIDEWYGFILSISWCWPSGKWWRDKVSSWSQGQPVWKFPSPRSSMSEKSVKFGFCSSILPACTRGMKMCRIFWMHLVGISSRGSPYLLKMLIFSTGSMAIYSSRPNRRSVCMCKINHSLKMNHGKEPIHEGRSVFLNPHDAS